MRVARLAGAIVAAPLAALAASPGWQAEAGVGGDHLGNGASNWRQLDFTLRARPADGWSWDGTLRQVWRSGLDDAEVGVAMSRRLDERWTLALTGQASPRHRVLPRVGGRVELGRQLGDGWVATSAFGRRVYAAPTSSGSSDWSLGAERYAGDWRAAVSIGRSRLDGGRATGNGRVQLDRWFADGRGRLGVVAGSGRELEVLPATPAVSADVLDQRTRTLAIVGAWPMAPAWALTGEVAHVRISDPQRASGLPAGAAYSRNGVRVGVRHDF